MIFAVLFADVPDGHTLRQAHITAHLDFLEAHSAEIKAAGPLDRAAGGGLWLVEAQDRSQVEALVREDPFWAAGLRADVEIAPWRRVFADGERL
ncbi:MAG: YciI family protein [Pseudomonadota bacterium]